MSESNQKRVWYQDPAQIVLVLLGLGGATVAVIMFIAMDPLKREIKRLEKLSDKQEKEIDSHKARISDFSPIQEQSTEEIESIKTICHNIGMEIESCMKEACGRRIQSLSEWQEERNGLDRGNDYEYLRYSWGKMKNWCFDNLHPNQPMHAGDSTSTGDSTANLALSLSNANLALRRCEAERKDISAVLKLSQRHHQLIVLQKQGSRIKFDRIEPFISKPGKSTWKFVAHHPKKRHKPILLSPHPHHSWTFDDPEDSGADFTSRMYIHSPDFWANGGIAVIMIVN